MIKTRLRGVDGGATEHDLVRNRGVRGGLPCNCKLERASLAGELYAEALVEHGKSKPAKWMQNTGNTFCLTTSCLSVERDTSVCASRSKGLTLPSLW
jgi:hypothetical protein